MARVAIACEHPDLAGALVLAERVRGHGRDPHIASRDHYPTADPMTRFLGQLEAQFALTLVLISDGERATGWITRELCLRHLYPSDLRR